MSDFQQQFHKKVRQGKISGGGDFVFGSLLANADVLSLGDVDHRHSGDMYADLLSPEKLQAMHAQGVRDIFTEGLSVNQAFVTDLANGHITQEQFVSRLSEETCSIWMGSDQEKKTLQDLAKAIVHAASLNPPIKIHLADQRTEMRESSPEHARLQEQYHAAWDKMYERIPMLIDSFTKELSDRNLSLNPAMTRALEKLQNNMMPSPSSQGRGCVDGEGLFGLSEDYLDFFGVANTLRKEGKIDPGVQELLDVYRRSMIDPILDFAKAKKAFFQKMATGHNDEFDMDKVDMVLANYILTNREPGTKSVIIYGAGHGANSHNDLDENLQRAGLSVARVDVVYPGLQIDNFGVDRTEIAYYPKADNVKFHDWNKDGAVNGAPFDARFDGKPGESAASPSSPRQTAPQPHPSTPWLSNPAQPKSSPAPSAPQPLADPANQLADLARQYSEQIKEQLWAQNRDNTDNVYSPQEVRVKMPDGSDMIFKAEILSGGNALRVYNPNNDSYNIGPGPNSNPNYILFEERMRDFGTGPSKLRPTDLNADTKGMETGPKSQNTADQQPRNFWEKAFGRENVEHDYTFPGDNGPGR